MLSNFLNAIRTSIIPAAGEDRRRWTRHKRCTLLTLQELDDDLSTVGSTKWAMSQNISQMGIGFVCSEPVSTNYIRITIVEDSFSAIGLIRHSRLLEGEVQQYFVGVEFIDDYACHER